MKFREIDNVKKKTMSCLPKGCLSLPKVKRRQPKTRRGKDETDINEEDFINAYEANHVGSAPRYEVNGISKEEGTKTFQPSYHVYRFVSVCIILQRCRPKDLTFSIGGGQVESSSLYKII